MLTAPQLSETNPPGESVGWPGKRPYLVTVVMNDSTSRVALAATPGVAFAAYYAALRDNLDARVVLSHTGRTVIASHS